MFPNVTLNGTAREGKGRMARKGGGLSLGRAVVSMLSASYGPLINALSPNGGGDH